MVKAVKDKRYQEIQTKSGLPIADNFNYSQKWAQPVRPQKPSDNTQMGQPRWQPGQLPKGGFRSVFDFSTGPESTKLSPTSGGGGKVY